jgi:hypothetical protein
MLSEAKHLLFAEGGAGDASKKGIAPTRLIEQATEHHLNPLFFDS